MHLLFLPPFTHSIELVGMEQLCQEVTVRLQERGHDVWVFTSQQDTHIEAGETK